MGLSVTNSNTNTFDNANKKAVYGPIKSWRFGNSLGIDPIFETSTCSFNCFYCQLGNIQNRTTDRKVYVATKKVLFDFMEVSSSGKGDEERIDVIAFSGSGEPTLARNLGEISKEIKTLRPDLSQIVLTNGAHLLNPEVKKDLSDMDRVIVKLDACDQKTFRTINRPAPGISLDEIVEDIIDFKRNYSGLLDIQTMFCPINSKDKDIKKYCQILDRIRPDAVQLNIPKRPYPLSWHRENRGNHKGIFDYKVSKIKVLDRDRAREIEEQIKNLTELKILSFYH